MKHWIWIALMSAAFGQTTNASPTGHEWNNYSESFKMGYVLGFMNGAGIGAIREVSLCFQLTNVSFEIINTSNDFLKQWKEKYPEFVTTANNPKSQTGRPARIPKELLFEEFQFWIRKH